MGGAKVTVGGGGGKRGELSGSVGIYREIS